MADDELDESAAPRVNLAEYARHRGCSRAAVRKAIAQGRIVSVERDARGHWAIDVEAADREWAARTGPRKEVELAGRTPAGEVVEAATEPLGEDPDRPRSAADLLHAKTLFEEARAEEARLKVDQLRGNLVPADQVRKRWFAATRTIRETLLPLASRLAAELAAETDAGRLEIRLEAEIAQALAALSES